MLRGLERRDGSLDLHFCGDGSMDSAFSVSVSEWGEESEKNSVKQRSVRFSCSLVLQLENDRSVG